jgi:dTDP-4-dehydrorhamnose reductase
MKKMKVLITGASGLLGRAIKTEFEKVTSWNILGLGYSRLEGGLKKVDLTNDKDLGDIIDEFKPDVLIHSAAERRPDVVGNKVKETEALNIKSTENIAKLMAKTGGFVLYISTDYIFDGLSPPYTTKSKPNPLNKYGTTKLEGERVTMLNTEKYAILRVPILYGEVKFIKESAVTGRVLQRQNENLYSCRSYNDVSK